MILFYKTFLDFFALNIVDCKTVMEKLSIVSFSSDSFSWFHKTNFRKSLVADWKLVYEGRWFFGQFYSTTGNYVEAMKSIDPHGVAF